MSLKEVPATLILTQVNGVVNEGGLGTNEEIQMAYSTLPSSLGSCSHPLNYHGMYGMGNMIEATLIDSMGSDLNVVNAARVSFGKESEWEEEWVHCPEFGEEELKLTLKEKDAKLIKYLGEHGHISPFGHCFASFHVKAPIFVARQLVKHKFLRWNEVSRRYVDDAPEFYVPEVWRGRSEDKKQGSGGKHYLSSISTLNAEEVYKDVKGLYEWMIREGVCPEQARMVLPHSLLTEWWWSGSLDAFASMCNLRCKEDTQYETRLVAEQIDKKMKELYPHSWEALRDG